MTSSIHILSANKFCRKKQSTDESSSDEESSVVQKKPNMLLKQYRDVVVNLESCDKLIKTLSRDELIVVMAQFHKALSDADRKVSLRPFPEEYRKNINPILSGKFSKYKSNLKKVIGEDWVECLDECLYHWNDSQWSKIPVKGCFLVSFVDKVMHGAKCPGSHVNEYCCSQIWDRNALDKIKGPFTKGTTKLKELFLVLTLDHKYDQTHIQTSFKHALECYNMVCDDEDTSMVRSYIDFGLLREDLYGEHVMIKCSNCHVEDAKVVSQHIPLDTKRYFKPLLRKMWQKRVAKLANKSKAATRRNQIK